MQFKNILYKNLKFIFFSIKYKYFLIHINLHNYFRSDFKKKYIFKNRDEMLKFYCDKNNNITFLEIGVFKGVFLNFLNTKCNNIKNIYAVDLFEGVVCSANEDGNNMEYYELDKSYSELYEKYKNQKKVILIKGNSNNFLDTKDDNVFDIIYIDGDHSYESVKRDIINSYNKVVNGGYIMGHDYCINTNKTNNFYKFGVKKAVDEFCFEYNQTIISYALDGYVSFCIKIIKS